MNAKHKDLRELERRRVLRLALALRKRLELYISGNTEDAKAEWRKEGERLLEVRYGEELLNTVGRTYVLIATQIIGSFAEGMAARQEAFGMKVGAMQDAAEASKKTQAGAQVEGMTEDTLPSMLEMMWKLTVIDITGTVKAVVMKVYKDTSVSRDVQNKRANAIKELGEIWESLKSNKDGEEKNAREMYMSATAASMEAHLEKMRKDEEAAEGKL